MMIVSNYRRFARQEPLTRILDLATAMEVKVLAVPDPARLAHLRSFAFACHAESAEELEVTAVENALNDLVEGRTLWQSLETLTFMVLVKNCSRTFTHQLVRQRIGITFSQQCTGGQDCRHWDYVYPHGQLTHAIVDGFLRAKVQYAKLLDADTDPGIARLVLPNALSTFILFHASLGTLADIYRKRICPQSQCYETVVFARKLKAAIVEAMPQVERLFAFPCSFGNSCWWHRGKTGEYSTNLFFPHQECMRPGEVYNTVFPEMDKLNTKELPERYRGTYHFVGYNGVSPGRYMEVANEYRLRRSEQVGQDVPGY